MDTHLKSYMHQIIYTSDSTVNIAVLSLCIGQCCPCMSFGKVFIGRMAV